MSVFGQIITSYDAERAMADFLRSPITTGQPTWPSVYIGEIERLQGYAPNMIARASDAIIVSEFDKWPEDQVPLYLVISSGLAGRPKRHASSWECSWMLSVGALASDQSSEWTRKLAFAHTAAIRAAVLQHKSLGGFASDVQWVNEGPLTISLDADRTLMGAQVVFEVAANSAVEEHAGPPTPQPGDPVVDPSVPPAEWWAPNEIDVSVTPVALTESVR